MLLLFNELRLRTKRKLLSIEYFFRKLFDFLLIVSAMHKSRKILIVLRECNQNMKINLISVPNYLQQKHI